MVIELPVTSTYMSARAMQWTEGFPLFCRCATFELAAERIELPLKGQQAGPPTARQLWARGVLFTDVRALGISKKNIKEVLDKVVMLVTVQNKKQCKHRFACQRMTAYYVPAVVWLLPELTSSPRIGSIVAVAAMLTHSNILVG